MADNASTYYLYDKDNNIVLPATDWSVINNKPNNLATTDQLPQDTGWKNGTLMNGTNGLVKYRKIGKVFFLYCQIKGYPVSDSTPVADNAAISFPKFEGMSGSPDIISPNLISDWVSVDGNAKAQVGFKLDEGIMVVYRVEGAKSTMRFYKAFAV